MPRESIVVGGGVMEEDPKIMRRWAVLANSSMRDRESSCVVDTVKVMKVGKGPRTVLMVLAITAGLLTGAALDVVGSTGAVVASAATANCGAPRGTAVFTLTDMAPGVRLNLSLGSKVIVRTPKWHGEHATEFNNSNRKVLRQICSTLTSSGGRMAVFVAQHVGRSLLGATVTPPVDTFMPSWFGTVTVNAGSST
jgi:hypothetical protein